MQTTKNIVVEVYKKGNLRSILARKIDDVIPFLKSVLSNEAYIDPIIKSILSQRENPANFPNIVVFLNETNDPISIDSFFDAMFSIQLIHRTGGTKTAMGKTLADCRANAKRICAAFPGSFVAATIPYAVYKRDSVYDVSIPFEIKKDLGVELRFLIEDEA
jgi:hypothetical protein